MTPSNGKQHGTLYEQVLDFARREIEDASSSIDELRRSLHLLESRVEAAKSVYESVAARLNLEDELENEEIQLDAPTYAASQPSVEPPVQPEPPMVVPEPPPQAPVSQEPLIPPPPVPEPPPQAPVLQEPLIPPPPAPESPMFAPEPPAQAATPSPEPAPQAFASPLTTPPIPTSEPSAEPAPDTSGNNGASDDFSMDLIRRHLEERDNAAQKASTVPPRRPGVAPSPSSESIPTPAPAPAPVPEPEAKSEQPAAQGGFPGLSKADRDLIGEYLRSKRG